MKISKKGFLDFRDTGDWISGFQVDGIQGIRYDDFRVLGGRDSGN